MGAWIETQIRKNFADLAYVAPYMGAWIETFLYQYRQYQRYVAPYMGAWIETNKELLTSAP